MLTPKINYLILRDHTLFRFGKAISFDAKTRSVSQFIGAPQCNFEIADLGIKSLVPLASNGWVNPSDTLGLATESLHHSRPPHIEESIRCSKCVSRSIF